LLAFAPVVLALIAIVVILLVQYWRRIVDRSLTAHFRAAESIAEGYLPPQWAKEIEQHLRRRRWQRGLRPGRMQTGTALALDKLDKLTRFFAASSFFADAEAKTLLLDTLNSTRHHWEQMSWEQLRRTVPP
jgi:hypothetical protein